MILLYFNFPNHSPIINLAKISIWYTLEKFIILLAFNDLFCRDNGLCWLHVRHDAWHDSISEIYAVISLKHIKQTQYRDSVDLCGQWFYKSDRWNLWQITRRRWSIYPDPSNENKGIILLLCKWTICSDERPSLIYYNDITKSGIVCDCAYDFATTNGTKSV